MKRLSVLFVCPKVVLILGLIIVWSAPGLAQLNIGVLGGYAGGIAKSAIPDYDDTKWSGTGTYGAVLNYRLHSGISLGVRAEQVKLKLTETGSDLGTLTLRPMLATIGYQTAPPKKGRGLGGHVQFGGGVGLTSFEIGPSVRDLVGSYGGIATVRATVNKAPLFEMGGGVDYFLNRHVSLTSDFRILLGNAGTTWTVAVGTFATNMDWNKLSPSTAQILGGIRFWLK